MDKKEITRILEEIAVLLELKGENPFKSRAYSNAARVIESLNDDVIGLINSGEIGSVKGVGKAISEKLTILVEEGKLPYYETLKAETPPGLFEMLKIPGMGPKKVKAIYDALNISTVGELEYACKENRLRDLPGFGQKSQDKILEGIKLRKKYNERFHFHMACQEARTILSVLEEHPGIIRIEVAGSLRRKKETVKDIDIVASCEDNQRDSIMSFFTGHVEENHITGKGNTKSSIVLDSGIACDLRLVSDQQFSYTLHHFTGSKEHNTALRQRAKEMGMTMNEYGLYSTDKEKLYECADEEKIFEQLDLQYIPPELRENHGEIEASVGQDIPELVNASDVRGIFHVHTTWSDGAVSITEMAERCQQMGFEYIGITDHSKSAFYANGLSEDRIMKQIEEIDHLNSELNGFRIFKGIEADILPDGSMDYEDNVLAQFDFVIASVHSSFRMGEEQMTNRICKALENPYVTMLGHPTGRLILGREAYPLKMETVIETAAKFRKVIEINANPHRLDLDWRWGQFTRELGVKTSINPDAHSADGLLDFRIGVGIARKGWFTKEEIISCYKTENIEQFFQDSRNHL